MSAIRTLIILVSITMICSCADSVEYQKISKKEYQAKVYASWLGQCVGNIYGLPHENAYIDEPGPENWPYGYGRMTERLKKVNGAFSDDDTDIEYMYLLAMEKFGIEPKLKDLAGLWMYHVRDRVWLANRAALAAMHYGYTPPVTGWKSLNPHWFQIDPQLINEIWGVTSPGMVNYSAKKSSWAATVMDDDWGLEPTAFYGALYAAAFFETDVNMLLKIGLSSLDDSCRYKKTVLDMIDLYAQHPKDWQAARKIMADKYYHNEPIESKTIWNANLNGAAGILALLYGKGDFQKTLDLSCAMGFDADNQAATISGLLALMNGVETIPHELLFPFEDLNWEKPFNDIYVNVSRYDMPDLGLVNMSERVAKLGEEIVLKHGGKVISENGEDYLLINKNAEFSAPLEFPSAPLPYIEINKPVNFSFVALGGSGNYSWQITSGKLPEGLVLKDGKLSGITSEVGVHPINIKITDNTESLEGKYNIIVRGKNLTEDAAEVLANVKNTDTELRDSFWLTVSHGLYANDVEKIIRDGNKLGEGSTFYSLINDKNKKTDYYGYRWDNPVDIGVIALHTGSVEEMGGWFNTLDVEYMNESGKWVKADGVKISPSLPPAEHRFIRPNFVEYILTFKPVNTKAVRIIGEAGGLQHWFVKDIYHFTSISELSVYSSIKGL